ncbi:hypothetical protein ABK040_009630 [Willaertia magna]
MNEKRCKCVAIGDGAVGKTCLLIRYAKGEFPAKYIPTVFENYDSSVEYKPKQFVTLSLWDTAGQEGYENLRPLSYPNSDVILVCFSVVSPDSLDNVKDVWIPELKQHIPKTPIILCGLKTDLRNDPETLSKLGSQKPVTKEQAEVVAKEVGAQIYLECSAYTSEGLEEVFQTAILVGLKEYKKPSSGGGCLMM